MVHLADLASVRSARDGKPEMHLNGSAWQILSIGDDKDGKLEMHPNGRNNKSSSP